MVFLTAGGDIYARSGWSEKLSKQLLRQVKIRASSCQNLAFGHPLLGYFKPVNIVQKKGYCRFQFLPPTYRHPIQIVAIEKNLRISVLEERRYDSPLPKAFRLIQTEVVGNFSRPFFLLSGALPMSRFKRISDDEMRPELPLKNSNRFSFAMIVNKFGEIVWVHVPKRAGAPFTNYLVVKQVDIGRYAVLMSKQESSFEVVNWQGKLLKKLAISQLPHRMPLHHDFAAYDGRGFLSLGYSRHRYGTDRDYVASTIVKVDLKTSRLMTIFDFGNSFKAPLVSWKEDKQKKRFVHWDQKTADHDFTHANALVRVKDGFLVSFRHLNRVVLWDPKTFKIKWSVGRTPDNTFVTGRRSHFSYQHTPFFYHGDLVMFDNGFERRQSRIIGLRLKNNRAKLAWEFSPQPKLYSHDRGSVTKINEKNLLAYFVAAVEKGKQRHKFTQNDILWEFDSRTQRAMAKMKITFFTRSPGYRAVALSAIDNSTPIKIKNHDDS